MGGKCSGCTFDGKKSKGRPDYTTQPYDTNQFTPSVRPNLSLLKFDALLCNIKVYNCPKESLSLKFSIPNILQVLLPKKLKSENEQQFKWKLKQKFDFILNEYEIRKSFLQIQATDDKGKTISQMQINLYAMATGPYHHDFSFKLGKVEARLQFDLKISQYIETKVVFEETQIQLHTKYFPGDSFYFTVRIIRDQQEDPFESTPSYTKSIPEAASGKGRGVMQASQFDQCQSPLRIKGRSSRIPENTNNRLLWQASKGEMPNFKIFIRSHEMKKSLLHFVVWKIQKQERTIMFCDAHIPVYKLYIEDPSSDTENLKDSNLESRRFKLKQEKLQNNGDECGNFSLQLRTQNNKFLKQMRACARTQNGIITMVPLVASYGLNRQKRIGKLNVVEKSISEIENMNMEINKNSKLSFIAVRDIRLKMVAELEKMREALESSLDDSYSMPCNQEECAKNIDDQAFLLAIIFKVYAFLEDDEALAEVCWHIIMAIMKRGEFNLDNIGFTKAEQEQMKHKPSPYQLKKIKIGLNYQQIFNKLFLLSLKLGYFEGRENPKPVIEMFKAYCYFRMPTFRDILLKKVWRKEDESVEWKLGFQNDPDMMPNTQDMLVFQLDWDNYFYKPLSVEPKSQSLTKDLLQSLEGNEWLKQVSKRGSTFFYFLYFLVKRLLQLGKKIKFIKWQYFPGYNKLVRSFLYEMKKLSIVSYPKSLIQTSVNLLSNSNLINTLMTILLDKTNANDCNELMRSLELINRYFAILTKDKKMLPPTFNYVYFFKGIKIVLEGDFSYAIIKTMVIIYGNYQNFNVEFRKNLSLYLLGKVFFKLFLHWSYPVRSTFYHILVLKIGRSADVFDPDSRKEFLNRHEIMNEISTRYEEVIKLVRAAEDVHKKDQSKSILGRNDKDLHRVMKKKLNSRKRKESIGCANSDKHSLPSQQETNSSNYDSHSSKYSLLQLKRMNKLERSYSATIDIKMLDLVRNKIHKNKNEHSPIGKENKEEQISLNRIKSTQYKDNESEEEWKDHNTNDQKGRTRNRKVSFFGANDFEVEEMDKNEVKYIEKSMKEFNQLDEAIRKYIRQNGELPVCELDIDIPIDEQEIKPSTVAIDEWESKTHLLQ